MHERLDIDFVSAGTTCRAWFYPARTDAFRTTEGVPCVVMAHGLGGTRDAGLEPYAERFASAGLAVFLFDYRHFGASDGEPRQLLSVRRQLHDWRVAISVARRQLDVDAERVALWGSSFSGGHVIAAAARDGQVAAVTAQGPMMDGLAAVTNLASYAGIVHLLKLTWAGIRDAINNLAGADPYLIPIVGRPGTLAAMSSDDAYDGYHAITPPGWRNEIAARFALTLALYRPGKRANRLPCPALIQICDEDSVAPPWAAEATALHAGERGRERHYKIGHFDIYRDAGFRQSSADQVAFFSEHLTPEAMETRRRERSRAKRADRGKSPISLR
ncbi:alpha/beta hydrolase [Endozoicomonas sp. G2_2]|nr:alpha/beta hydrolase [Endozoicomonas sp. G2_2]MBO9470305.1 alpha/beta hydrolase [Endozoicomonas sp. G2_2]